MSQIVIISGPSGAGKSSVCEALCERYDRTVHIETDSFFEWIRMGRINPMAPKLRRPDGRTSRRPRRAAYAEQRYGVFIDGVIGPHLLPIYLDGTRRPSPSIHYC
jgi:predicted ABC-type ATPase